MVSYFPTPPAHVSMESKICILQPSTVQPRWGIHSLPLYNLHSDALKPKREIFLVSDLALLLLLPRGDQ